MSKGKVVSFDARLEQKQKEYAASFDIDTLDSANDKANLQSLLKNEILIEDLQQQISEYMTDGAIEHIVDIKKLSDILKDTLDRNLALERALSIDRKTRKTQSSKDDPATYILELKRQAKDFIDQRLVKMYCPNCEIMLARFSVVHDHSGFSLEVVCNQCQKTVRAKREEKDIFFDIPAKDRAWRKKYPMSVEQPKRKYAADTSKLDTVEDDVFLGSEEDIDDAEEDRE